MPTDILIRSKHTALLNKKNCYNKTAGVDCILHYTPNDSLRNIAGCLPFRLTQWQSKKCSCKSEIYWTTAQEMHLQQASFISSNCTKLVFAHLHVSATCCTHHQGATTL